jgi:hypothetical protein
VDGASVEPYFSQSFAVYARASGATGVAILQFYRVGDTSDVASCGIAAHGLRVDSQ